MKTKIEVGTLISEGKDNGSNVEIDIQKLILTRLLVLANSGGGKSWLLRRLAELLCGSMPVIIIDPEGEFATLREKFDFFLVGKGGDAPADIRTAKLVMHKFLELRASVVFDLSEMPIEQRHIYVKLISEAAIDSPKNYWRPTAFIFDEVHVFCPENGKGESVAKNAVIGFPTRGRKRQFLSIFATQRPCKLAMDARAEFQNRMIGMTFEPDDLKVAASTLGIHGKEETANFNLKMRTMDEGNFFAFGRAISLETILLKVGGIETSHGVGKSKKFTTTAPPTPEKIRAMLPSLADIPKEAEEKEQTEKQFRETIKNLKSEIAMAKRAAPIVQPANPEKKIVTVAALSKGERKRITALCDEIDLYADAVKRASNQLGKIQVEKDAIVTEASELRKILAGKLCPAPTPIPLAKAVTRIANPPPVWGDSKIKTSFIPTGDFSPDKCQRNILAVLSQFPEGCTMNKIALLARYSISGGFRNALGTLRTAGMISGENMGTMKITDAGMMHAQDAPLLPRGRDLIDYWKAHPAFSLCHRQIITVLAANSHNGDGLTMEEIAGQCSPPYEISGGFRNALGELRTAGVITGKNTDRMKLNDEMFT